MSHPDHPLLEGFIAVRAALLAGSRDLFAIWLREDKLDVEAAFLERAAAERGVPLHRVGAAVIDEWSDGRSHGGVIAEIGPRRFVSLDELLPTDGAPFIVMLDGVEDPYNFGQALRALYAAGADGVVVRRRNWTSAAAVVARASAGASEQLPMAVADSAESAAAFFRERGLAIAATAREDGRPLYAANLTNPLFLLIGGERRGLGRSLRQQADLLLNIPYGRDFPHSLGATAATAVLAFEVMRQRARDE